MAQRSSIPWRVVACLAALLTSACGGDDAAGSPGEAARRTPIPAVEVVEAREGALPLFQRLTGSVRASGEVAIFPQTSGSIVEVLVENGDAVRKGAPLVRIQAVGSEAQLAQSRSGLTVARAALREAEANLKQLEAQYERNAALGEKGLVPVDTVVTLRTQVEAVRAAAARARAEVEMAEGAVEERADVQRQSIVRAPISGRVGQRNAEVGMRVDEQAALFVIGRLDRVRVEVPVTQDIVSRLRVGQRVDITVGESVPPITAEVSRISPFLQAGSYSAEVEVDVPNPDGALVAGMLVTADIYYGESEEATLVPTSALYQQPTTGERGVFVSATAPPALPAARSGGPGGAAQPEPIPLSFRVVEVIAEGPLTVGVRGIEPGTWVVVVGQPLLSSQANDGPPRGRARPIEWDRVLELQRLQRDDLLREFMDKQRRLAGGPAGGT